MNRGWTFVVSVLPFALGAQAQSPNLCDEPGESPDVIVGDLIDIGRWGVVGDITGFSIGTDSCNIGTCWLDWLGGTPNHPVIGQNMFRLKDGRFEQIGQGWLKHGYGTFDWLLCGDCIPADGQHLGVNCSDPYSAGLNGSQSKLGPKFEVNPETGTHLHPYTGQGQFGSAIYKRLQLEHADLDPQLNRGAVYFGEGQYVAADDAAAGNGANNNSYRPVSVSGANGDYTLVFSGATVRMLPALHAWSAADPTVELKWLLSDFVFADKVTDLGDGRWHYEYAVQNVVSHRAAQRLRVPLPHGAEVTNIGFHDVDYHSGEPYDGTDWSATIETGTGPNFIEWSTATFAENPNANALRWGTLYNFRFDADVAPATGLAEMELFLPGDPVDLRWVARLPDRCGDSFCEGTETVDVCPADCSAARGGAGSIPGGDGLPGDPLTVRIESNGDVTLEWDVSCRVEDTDYEVYEGLIGDFATRGARACSTGGATTWTFPPAAGGTYYLVVPNSGSAEGSYGQDSGGVPRRQGDSPCMEQAVESCR